MNDKSHFLVRMQKINKEHQIRKELEEEKKSSNGNNLNKEIGSLKFKLQELEDIQRDTMITLKFYFIL